MKRSTRRRRARRFIRRSPGYVMFNLFWVLAACSGLQWPSCEGNCTHPYDGTSGSCPEAGAATGAPGGQCNDIFCESGATCVDGTCIPCGADHQVCCVDAVLENPTCNPGFTCSSETSTPECSGSCGLLGLYCCGGGGTECIQGACDADTEMCEDPTGTEELCQGSTPYSGYAVDAYGCVERSYSFSADSEAAAAQCLAALAERDSPPGDTWTPSALNVPEYPATACEFNNTTFMTSTAPFNVVDQSNLQECAESLCAPPTCEVQVSTNGSCPGA